MPNEDPPADLGREGSPAALDFEEIVATRLFALGAGEDFYGVWNLRRPDQPLATYPKTDAGFGQAEEQFDRLRHSEPRDRATLMVGLRWTLLLGLVVWAISGGIYDIIYAKGVGSFSSAGLSRFATVMLAVSMIANRVWVAALVGLIVLWLRRGLGVKVEPPPG